MITVTALDKQGSRGLYSPDTFGGITPKGKAGKKISVATRNGIVHYTLGAKIGDKEHLLAVVLLSNFFKDYLSDISEIKIFEDEKDPLTDTEILRYTNIYFNIGDLAYQMYKDRKYAKRLKQSFNNLSLLDISYDNNKNLFDNKKRIINLSHFGKFEMGKGLAKVPISNLLLAQIKDSLRGIRLHKVLLQKPENRLLSLFIETYQVQYNGNSIPQQTYKVEDIVMFLGLEDRYKKSKSETIKLIKDKFNQLNITDKDLPKYIYDSDKEFFYNEYKKGAIKSLFED